MVLKVLLPEHQLSSRLQTLPHTKLMILFSGGKNTKTKPDTGKSYQSTIRDLANTTAPKPNSCKTSLMSLWLLHCYCTGRKRMDKNGSYLLAQIRLEHQCHLVSQLNWVHPRIWQPDRQKQFGCLHLYMMLYSIEICSREHKNKLRSDHILCSISQTLTNPKLRACEYIFFLIW